MANQYAANEMYTEALNTYNVIVKNKMFSNAGIIYLCSLLETYDTFLVISPMFYLGYAGLVLDKHSDLFSKQNHGIFNLYFQTFFSFNWLPIYIVLQE